MSAAAWALLALGILWFSALLGTAISDWRDRHRGEQPDQGYWP